MATAGKANGTHKQGNLARGIADWTSKLLLSAIVLVAGIGFGRQVLQWWAGPESPSAAVSSAVPAGSAGLKPALREDSPLRLCFGQQPWMVCRQTVLGDRDKASAALREWCKQTVATAAPKLLTTLPPLSPENRLLKQLAGAAPVERQPGQWRLFQSPAGLPLVLLVSEQAEPGAGGDAATRLSVGGDTLPVSRMLAWGLAVPHRRDAWTLYAFLPAEATVLAESHMAVEANVPEGANMPGGATGPGAANTVDSERTPNVPLPSGATRTLAVTEDGGWGIVAFEGSGEAATWQRFYDRWAAENGWRQAVAWQDLGGSWTARFAATSPTADRTLDIRFGPHHVGGTLVGVLVISPPFSQNDTRGGR